MDKAVMHDISYGLYVLTASMDGRDNGCIINTLSQVTSSPNRISVTVNKQNHTHDMIVRTGVFNVSFISEDAGFWMFEHFGFRSGRDCDKFDRMSYPVADNGVRYVDRCTRSYLSGRVVQSIDLGTHTMFIADVTGGEKICECPPMTYAYYHKNVKPAPQQNESKGYRCKLCGYVYEGDVLPADFVCPICKHGADDFEAI
ncbi:MAG: flavin reductase [Clostridia bacterium]|nr:flavin reductase [Clostridia bacterium]